MSEYWQACLPELLEDAGIRMDGIDVRALCKRVSQLANAESSYSPPVSRARIGLSDYDRGVAEGRRQALEEVRAALGASLELAKSPNGLKLQMSDEYAWRGHSGVKIT